LQISPEAVFLSSSSPYKNPFAVFNVAPDKIKTPYGISFATHSNSQAPELSCSKHRLSEYDNSTPDDLSIPQRQL